MKLRGILLLGGAVAILAMVWSGCANVKQLSDPEPEFETLTVAYGDPGLNPQPCNDALPIIDGVATDQEWSLAEPLFVRMSGENGNGGSDFFLEIRAIWTDEEKTGGGSNRIYFLLRYPDKELNAAPDALAYIRPLEPNEFCRNTIEIDGELFCPSPTPQLDGTACDPVVLDPSSWRRINRDGQEDQVLVAITEVANPAAASGLIDLNQSLTSRIGPETPDGYVAPAGVGNVDIWMWRAGRTNLHPINQFPDWTKPLDEITGLPDVTYSNFLFTCGFAEDLWIDGSGNLMDDDGRKPFVKNFNRTDLGGELLEGVPIQSTECPPRGRELSEEDLATQNGGIPKDLGLWWPSAKAFKTCDTLACSRVGLPPKWSTRLLPGEYDRVSGWGHQIPFGGTQGQSGINVRTKGTFEETQEKGFGIRALEIMRDMNTGESDDIEIKVDGETEFRIVIGIFDNSGKTASGSTEIRLRFEAPKPKLVGEFDRC